MAKRLTQILGLFEPPAPTREDATEPIPYGSAAPRRAFNCGHPHEDIYPDGIENNTGGSLPEDVFLDRIVYPHDESDSEASMRRSNYARNSTIEGFKEQAHQESRQFRVDADSACGLEPGQGRIKKQLT